MTVALVRYFMVLCLVGDCRIFGRTLAPHNGHQHITLGIERERLAQIYFALISASTDGGDPIHSITAGLLLSQKIS